MPFGKYETSISHIQYQIIISFSGGYWSHIQEFEEFIRRIVRICSAPPFQTFSTFRISNVLIFPKIIFPNIGLSSWIIWSVLMSLKISNIGFGSRGHIKQVRKILKNNELLGFPRMKPNSYWTKKNNYTKLLGYAFHNITIEMSPRPPSTPNPLFFPDVPGSSIGNLPFSGLW